MTPSNSNFVSTFECICEQVREKGVGNQLRFQPVVIAREQNEAKR